MKLRDWNDEEEKATKPRKDSSGKTDSEFGDMNSDSHEIQLRQRNQRAGEEEELAPLPMWAKALIFMGLAVLAALICAVLWHFTHLDKAEEQNQGDLAGTIEASGDTSNQWETTEQTSSSESEDESDGASGAGEETAPNPQPEVSAEPKTSSDRETSENETDSSEPQTSGQPDPTEGPTATPQPTSQPGEAAQAPEPGNGGMNFTAVQETVTPKEAVNLRTTPTTADEENIVVKIQNGESLARIGINNDTGWSKIDYNGQTLYAVSQYLTTDLNYKTPVAPVDPNRVTTAEGSVIIFENCDDWITPKEYVNLRTEPSTVQEDATVSCQLNNGEKAHRTGYSADFGWSRVEYNGQVLYVVTSFVNVVPAQ